MSAVIPAAPSAKSESGNSALRAVAYTVWLADLTYTQQTIASDVMPYAIGGIATFAETRLAFPKPIRLFKYPERLIEAIERDGPPDILGLSNYIWNAELGAEFARLVKKIRPDTIVVVGGPNYPVVAPEQEAFLQSRPEIDFYIVKEGELAFTRLIEALLAHRGDVTAVKSVEIPSVHCIDRSGRAQLPATVERIRDLAEIPSPYVTGRLDEFFDGLLLPIVQTNRGCPFGCTFCVEGVGYYNKIYRNTEEKIAAEFDYIGGKMAALRTKGGRNDLFIADSNFGMYQEDLETCRQLARTQKLYQWPEYVNVATGKNQKERVLEASRLISGAMRLSGSVQSLDQTVLANIKRANISAEALMDLALRASEVGANSYSEIILGLPGDSKEAHYRTVRTIMEAGFTNIYLFQLMLLPGTELATEETKRKYGMVTRYRVLPRCYGAYDGAGGEIRAAEIEEICVANDTLSFEDYVECRKLHLAVTIFHNDAVFVTLLKLLRQLGVSVYRWMELIRDGDLPAGLRALFDSFERATREELWEDGDALRAFTREPGTIQKFVAGELGNNLLFVHKSLALTRHVSDLVTLARSTVRQCLAEAGKDTAEVVEFVDDALAYHAARMSNIFANRDVRLSRTLRFDIKRFEEDRCPGPIADYRLAAPCTYVFVLDETQTGLIDRNIGIYGDTPVGIGRIVSKVYVRRLFRHAIAEGEAVTGDGELRFRIAGLQN